MHTHPIEFVIGSILPMLVGPALLGKRMHRACTFGWYLIRAAEGIDDHCGYEFPWSPFRILPFQM